ncbi:MAG: serine/threonine-protein kinase [Pirellulaceae bacterium]
MIATQPNCLRETQLADVLSGRLPADDFDSALEHLDDCDTCRTALETIEKHEPWLVRSLADQSVDPIQAETACQVALWQMLQSPQQSSTVTAGPPCDKLGPYQLSGTLGSGGMGTVYLAQHDRLKRQCAIKLLPRERVDQPGWLDRFDREMTSVANLEHPNVVRATDAGHQDGWHYLVMEFLDGMDVGQVASRMQQIEVADVCEIIRQAALGLAHIHDAGLVHRDIKPSNLMLCRDGNVKILDLGLVLAGDDPLSKDDRLTTVGHLMGTMPYMAPEQLADSRDVDTRADLYSLGATFYRLLAGRPPHQRRRSLAAHILAISNEDAPPLGSFRDGVDPDLIALVHQMLARDPAHRPASASEIAARLEPFSKPSRLKRLLRMALRRPVNSSESVSIMPSVSVGAKPPRRPWKRWLMGAGAAGVFLLAAMIFKIKTDKGDLVIHSEQSDLTVVVRQDDQIVQRLTVDKVGDHRTVLRKGTYRVEIEGGGDALKLSEDVVTIGRGQVASVNVLSQTRSVSSDSQRLFQGEPLGHWMSILRREEDVRGIGLAMDAVERLSRESEGVVDSVQRREAANLTVMRARELGGIVLGGFGEDRNAIDTVSPSHRFMSYFVEVFPKYFAQPGLEVVHNELKDGNAKSYAAVLMAFRNYTSGVSDSAENLNSRQHARDELRALADTPDGQRLCDSVQNRIRAMIESGPLDHPYSGYILEMADQCLLALTLSIHESIVGIDWAEMRVRDKMNDYVVKWNDAGSPAQFYDPMTHGGFGGGSGSPLPDADVIWGAVQIASSDSQSKWWPYLTRVFLDQQLSAHYTNGPKDHGLDAIMTHAPDLLVRSLTEQLSAMFNESVQMEGRKNDGRLPSMIDLANENSAWNKLLTFYANHSLGKSKDAQAALELLSKVRSEMKRHDFEKVFGAQNKPFAAIDEAIATLKESLVKTER